MFFSLRDHTPATDRYSELSIGGTVITLTDTVSLDGISWVLIVFQDGPISYRYDGGTPTAVLGFTAYDGNSQGFWKHIAQNLKFIRTGSVNGLIRIQPYVGRLVI